ncbi:MCE family protein [Mycobacterium sp. SMC-4]|uniref:MCE family protein n=1 Tax=Mycobacterium sp. SMC-4 TaxID=2857059 RepID=UPI0021B26381|nr:MlaD family protein [Mycobacterium sp. SMC-4]UXA19815.1 MCE family protein [Mycobacterium sp. SMC-4]
MLTRFVRLQLIIFTIASIIGVTTMVVSYLQVPTLLGVGRITVTLELPRGGGLYRLANVTYRGAQIGKVADVTLAGPGAEVTLLLDRSTKVPADLVAEVRSVSAIGEQYVDLRPRSAGPPYLADGSVISIRDTEVPQPVGPMLDRTSALLGSIPGEQVSALLDETARAFDGAGYDVGSLIDSAAVVAKDSRGAAEQLRMLIDDSRPLLDGQIESEQDTRTWTRSLANVTDQLVTNDPQLRTILASAPGALGEVTELLDSVRPTLPVLLANLTSVGQVAVTYLPSLEQLLVLVPPFFANLQAIAPNNNATGLPLGDFRIQMNDPPACTVGFLPPSQWRSPADTTTVDTPEGLYCKLPQDSPIAVRGARNLPCMARPGKRAPTVEICDSDEPYVPLAMRQHALGPAPFDPNLVSQGVAPDDRTTFQERIFAPPEGTRPPAEAGVAPPPPPSASGAPPAAPSSAQSPAEVAPAVAVRTYDPRTGRYLAPGGTVGQQSNLATATQPTGWQDLVIAPEYLSP